MTPQSLKLEENVFKDFFVVSRQKSAYKCFITHSYSRLGFQIKIPLMQLSNLL